ncbi:nitroreductase family deazaflavin-dependent oxidoreductase [Streptomyces venezuelae]|uniref:Nitroreductase family deazaflavin-dependent oxidoreductase n=2 Tax=Streptomyces venezuelae TaxID=54571 RepID=A0A5P2DBT0_STRVZ|nr:nitroreductase family deazaflavin-dependent oxidoreductase [Streptomyces venezuelae]
MVDWDHPMDPEPGWRLDHVREYVATGGAAGHLWRGVPTLLLTTVGRHSGRAVRTPLIYGEDPDTGRYILVASAGGGAEHPHWYRNLDADPVVRVQVGPEIFQAKAHTAAPEEREAYWGLMTGLWPQYDDYQARTTREIPLVLLER